MSKSAPTQPAAPTDPSNPAARGTGITGNTQTGSGTLKGGASTQPPPAGNSGVLDLGAGYDEPNTTRIPAGTQYNSTVGTQPPAAAGSSTEVAGWNGNGDPIDSAGNVIPGGQRINSAPVGVTPTYAAPPPPAGAPPPNPGLPSGAAPSGASNPNNPSFTDMPYGDLQKSLDNSNVPALMDGKTLQDFMKQHQDAAYRSATGYLDPQFAAQQRDMETKLANQGVPQNSEAWNRAMDEFNRNRSFAYGQAFDNSFGQGLQAEGQMFGQGLAANTNQFGQNLQSGNFRNNAQNQYAQQVLGANALSEQQSQHNFQNSMALRQQDINELLMQQQNPMQMLNYLLSGNNVQSPNFTQTPGANIGGTDIAGIINAAMGQQNNVYNTQVGNANSRNSGISQILAAILMGG